MKTIATHGTFEEVLAASTPEIRTLAQQVRTLIREVMPDVVEVPWPRQRVAGYGVGPKKMSEHFCYIAPQQGYVNLGFYYGAELPDPEGCWQERANCCGTRRSPAWRISNGPRCVACWKSRPNTGCRDSHQPSKR